MATKRRTHTTSRVSMQLTNGSTEKKAGSNSFSITVGTDDWRLRGGQTVRMTVREAQAVRRFLNQHLDSE